MTRAQAFATLPLIALTLSGCEMFQNQGAASSRPAVAAPQAAAPAPTPKPSGTEALQSGGQSVAQLDTTTAAEKAEAAKPAAGGGKLGSTIASLGDATEGGFWLKTPLVSAPAKGRVVDTASGKSANVDLMPLSGGGAGSQISLAAMQTLGLSLTDLPELEVWRN